MHFVPPSPPRVFAAHNGTSGIAMQSIRGSAASHAQLSAIAFEFIQDDPDSTNGLVAMLVEQYSGRQV